MITIKKIKQGKVVCEVYCRKEDLLFIQRYIDVEEQCLETLEFQIRGMEMIRYTIKRTPVDFFEIGGLDNNDE